MNLAETADSPALLVAADHTLLAEAVASAATRAGYGEVRIAHDLVETFCALNEVRKPSAILIDLDLVSAHDFEGLEELESRVPGIPVVVMLRNDDIEDVNLVIGVFIRGALGIVSKDRGVESLMRVLEVVRQGEAAIPRSMARAVIEALRTGPGLIGQDVGLSPRQREVLSLVARGMTDREIARRLQITLPTVRSHLEAIFEKTRTTNRTAAARWAGLYLREPHPLPSTGG